MIKGLKRNLAPGTWQNIGSKGTGKMANDKIVPERADQSALLEASVSTIFAHTVLSKHFELSKLQ